MHNYRIFLKDGDYEDVKNVTGFEIVMWSDGGQQDIVFYLENHGVQHSRPLKDVAAVSMLDKEA